MSELKVRPPKKGAGSPPPLHPQLSGILLSLNCVIDMIEITLQQAMLSARNGPPPWTGPPPRSPQLPNCTDTEAPNTDTYKTMIQTVGGTLWTIKFRNTSRRQELAF